MNYNLIRGTTPTLTFTLPFSAEQLDCAYVTLSQVDKVIVDKRVGTAGCTCSSNTITTQLTQDETLKLSGNAETSIQIRAKTKEGVALASNIIKIYTKDILRDGVI